MNTETLSLTRQLNDVCTASNLDKESQAAALQSCFATISTNSALPLVDYDHGGLRIEINRMVATLKGKPIAFTGNEWKIMVALIKANGSKVSKEEKWPHLSEQNSPNFKWKARTNWIKCRTDFVEISTGCTSLILSRL